MPQKEDMHASDLLDKRNKQEGCFEKDLELKVSI
jgi:hypothetical protein